MLRRLNPLRDHADAETPGQTGDGVDDLSAFARLVHRLDETAVHFQSVEGQAVQLAERGIAGAKIVNFEADSHLGQFIQNQVGRRGIVRQDRFGHFQPQSAGGEPGPGKHFPNQTGQFRIGELPAGEVHTDRDRVEIPLVQREVTPPLRHLSAGLLQHPAPQRDHQPGFFRHRHELGRPHQPAVPLPAQEGLETGQPAGAQADLRLVVKQEFLPLKGVPQIGLEPESLDGSRVHAPVENGKLPSTRRFGVVHGRVRVLQGVFRVGAGAASISNANARAGKHESAGEMKRRFHFP